MKKELIIAVLIISIFGGCSPIAFYQLHNTESNDIQKDISGLVYENDEIKITYNFWADQGDGSFLLYNKTTTNLFLDLTKSHFVVNDFARTYYYDFIYKQSDMSIQSTSKILNLGGRYGTEDAVSGTFLAVPSIIPKSKDKAVKRTVINSYKEPLVCIPPNTFKIIQGFEISASIYRDCQLLKRPTSRNVITRKFSQYDSPLIFRNVISYGFNEHLLEDYNFVENVFWVSEITSYTQSQFFDRKPVSFCDETSTGLSSHYRHMKPERFFIGYSLDGSLMKY